MAKHCMQLQKGQNLVEHHSNVRIEAQKSDHGAATKGWLAVLLQAEGGGSLQWGLGAEGGPIGCDSREGGFGQ